MAHLTSGTGEGFSLPPSIKFDDNDSTPPPRTAPHRPRNPETDPLPPPFHFMLRPHLSTLTTYSVKVIVIRRHAARDGYEMLLIDPDLEDARDRAFAMFDIPLGTYKPDSQKEGFDDLHKAGLRVEKYSVKLGHCKISAWLKLRHKFPARDFAECIVVVINRGDSETNLSRNYLTEYHNIASRWFCETAIMGNKAENGGGDEVEVKRRLRGTLRKAQRVLQNEKKPIGVWKKLIFWKPERQWYLGPLGNQPKQSSDS